MNSTDIAVASTMAIALEVIDTDGSATEVAVSVTEVPGAVTGGAVYIVVAPLAVCAGTTQPHPPASVLPHWAVQVTPPGATSLVTVTLTGACAVESSVEGGCWVNASEGGSLTIVVIAMPELAG